MKKYILENLHISTIDESANQLAEKYKLGIELCQFTTSTNLEGNYFPYWFENSMKSREFSKKLIFHAPFNEIYPTSIDDDVRNIAMKKLNKAYEISYNYLGVKKMIVHSGYVSKVYFHQWFVEKSIDFWRYFMRDKPEDFILCIENVFDESPAYLKEIIDGLKDARVGACLDIGHANVVSDMEVEKWVEELSHRIYHVHLHNNFGRHDEHGELEDGNIDMDSVFEVLYKEVLKNGECKFPNLTFTLETRQSEKSIKYLLDI